MDTTWDMDILCDHHGCTQWEPGGAGPIPVFGIPRGDRYRMKYRPSEVRGIKLKCYSFLVDLPRLHSDSPTATSPSTQKPPEHQVHMPDIECEGQQRLWTLPSSSSDLPSGTPTPCSRFWCSWDPPPPC